jgi:hypothetical protein
MSEIAYKFTRPGARSPFTGFKWPENEWVEAEGEVALCTNGIHGCRLEALPRWIDEELWRVEIEDVQEVHEGVVVARRGRLLERIEAWDADTSRELAHSCAVRARQLAEENPDPLIRTMADDIYAIAEGSDPSATALSMYCTAHAEDIAAHGGYAAERRRQAEWLRDRLQLDAPTKHPR